MRYTPGESGEDALILKRWNELLTNAPVLDPSKCMKDFSLLQSSKVKQKLMRKKNVRGCYLGQYLTKVRHASDVFYHTLDMLTFPVLKGKFTKEEDELILSKVAESGECSETWTELAQKLNRGNCKSMKERYIRLIANKNWITGKFCLSEDESILRGLFGCKRETGIKEVESITFSGTQPWWLGGRALV